MTLTEIATAARDMNIARQNLHRNAVALHEQATHEYKNLFGLNEQNKQQQGASPDGLASSNGGLSGVEAASSIDKDPW
jgi:hypothetical protein